MFEVRRLLSGRQRWMRGLTRRALPLYYTRCTENPKERCTVQSPPEPEGEKLLVSTSYSIARVGPLDTDFG